MYNINTNVLISSGHMMGLPADIQDSLEEAVNKLLKSQPLESEQDWLAPETKHELAFRIEVFVQVCILVKKGENLVNRSSEANSEVSSAISSKVNSEVDLPGMALTGIDRGKSLNEMAAAVFARAVSGGMGGGGEGGGGGGGGAGAGGGGGRGRMMKRDSLLHSYELSSSSNSLSG